MSDQSLILGIETSNPSALGGAPGAGPSVALMLGERVVGYELLRSTDPNAMNATARRSGAGGGHDDDLMPAIDRVFRSAGCKPRQLARIGVSIGPGGFTGLRVACATAKMIAEGCRAGAAGAGPSCIAVPTAAAVFAGLDMRIRAAGVVAIALASKSETAWIELRKPSSLPGQTTGGVVVEEGRVINAEQAEAQWVERGVKCLIADQFVPAQMRTLAQRLGISVVPPSFDARCVASLARTLPEVDALALNPFYPREPDAVTIWRERSLRSNPGQ